MFTDPILLGIFHRFPPRETIFKESGGRPEEEYELETTRPFYRWFGSSAKAMFAGKDVLDLGSGFGGSAVWFERYGARSVTGLEVEEDKVAHAHAFADKMHTGATSFCLGTGEQIPLPAGSFDLITMYDVLEHVVSPRDTLAECYRVLRPDGALATVFPPYYDVLCGSHLHGYVTRCPGLNLIFTTRQLRSAATKLFAEQRVPYRRYFREVPSDKLWNQNGLTVRGFLDCVERSEFELGDLRLIGHRDPRLRDPGSPARRLFYSSLRWTAQLPVLREVLCARVSAWLVKPSVDTEPSLADAGRRPLPVRVGSLRGGKP